MDETSLPTWFKNLIGYHRQGIGRIFILHDNINDHIRCPRQNPDWECPYFLLRPRPFRDFLTFMLASGLPEGSPDCSWPPFAPILYSSPTIPLRLYYFDDKRFLHRPVEPQKLVTKVQEFASSKKKEPPDFRSSAFADQVAGSSRPTDHDMVSLLSTLEPLLESSQPKGLRLVLILDFFEKITTQAEGASDYKLEEIIRRFAISDRIKESTNMVIGLTVDYEALPRLLRSPDSQVHPLRIPLPDLEERRRFLSYWRQPLLDKNLKLEIDLGVQSESERSSDDGEQLKTLAGLTKGFRLVNLDALNRLSKTAGQDGKITKALLQRYKADLIRDESQGLLEEIPPKRDFETIGGLDYAVKYFRRVAEEMAQIQKGEKVADFPKGILLVGPPGTGKTMLAEALAKEAHTTLVKLGDIQHHYVGQSERNMSRTLALLKELAPVVVFVDEIDQSIGRRSTGREGDSGVSRRLFGKLLEFMGDNRHRGKILWVAASNRPDLLDEAMISRFDTVMAILLPYSKQQKIAILSAFQNSIEGVTYDDFESWSQEVVDKWESLSGRAIETLVRKAAQLARGSNIGKEQMVQAIDRFKPNINIRTYDELTIRALIAVNFTDMMPSGIDDFPDRLKSYVSKAVEERSNLYLEECLRRILDPESGFYASVPSETKSSEKMREKGAPSESH